MTIDKGQPVKTVRYFQIVVDEDTYDKIIAYTAEHGYNKVEDGLKDLMKKVSPS